MFKVELHGPSFIILRLVGEHSEQSVSLQEILLKSEPDSALIINRLQTQYLGHPAHQSADLESWGLILQLMEARDPISRVRYLLQCLVS